MPEIRPLKPDDQENAEKGFKLILDLMKNHPEIEPTLWAGTLFSVIVNGYRNSDVSYKEFCVEIDRIKKFYKQWWED